MAKVIYFMTNSLKMYAGQRVRIRLLMLVILYNYKNVVHCNDMVIGSNYLP